ncbi:endothelin-3b isoform X1 [Mobula hypostoma]|uniref:endothelin-3b isoform X1 n=1 Tax=Mobula hypostoma TaxID=723540 RepID=UPI002FC2FA97
MKDDGCRDLDVEGDSQGSTSPPQSSLPRSRGRDQPGSSETPPSSTVIVQAAKSVHTLSPSRLTSLQMCSYPPSAQQGALQNSSVRPQGSSQFCYVPPVSSAFHLQASQSERMDQIGKEPSPVPPCQRGSRLDCQTTVLQPSPCSPRASPMSNSLGLDPTPTPPRFQSPSKTTNFQPSPPAPIPQSPLHTIGLQVPAVQPPPPTSGFCPPLQTHRLSSAPKTLGLQIPPYNPRPQSHLRPSRFHLLSLPAAIQPSTFALRLQTVGPPPTPHLPELRPPPGVHRLQPSPQTSVAQIGTRTPGLPTPRKPGVQPPLQAPSYGEELHIVQLSKSIQQVRAKGQRKYVCGECGRDCAKRSALEKHLRSHTGVRPFPCTTCGISFKTQSNLYKHNRTQSHLHNCQVSAELQRSNRPEPSATNSSGSLVKDRGPCERTEQEARGNGHSRLCVASSRGNTKHQNLAHRDTSWCVVGATEKSEDSTMDGEKQDKVQTQPGHIGNRHLVLQRQQATYFAKRWVNKSSSSSVQTNESTDSGYLSHSDSPDQPLLASGSLQSLQRQNTESESERSSQPVRPLSSVGRSALGSAAAEEQRTTRGSQELGEWISKLISDNKAVVDDKHLETVRPRRTLNSKQGSIDLPMPYTFKDSFHFDMKSVQVNKKPRGASSLPAFSNQLKFHSLPEQISSTADCLPVIRSNSVPLSKGGLICGNVTSSSSCRPYELQRDPTSLLLVTNSQSHSLEFRPLHHRTLVRQAALEGLPAGNLTAERAAPALGNKLCDSKAGIPKPNCKSSGKNNGQKRRKKFSHERWSMYGEETFRKKYLETKGATHSALTASNSDTSALPEKPHDIPLVAPSAHKIPVKKHFSDPLPLGSVKVTTFNSPVCEVGFSQINVDRRSPLRRHPDPCDVATETKTAPIPGRVVEAPAVTTPSSAEMLPTAERTGKVTAPCAARETAGDTSKEPPLHQRSATASSHIEKDVTRPFSHPKLVRQLSVLVPESKAKQEASSQQKSKSNEFSLQQGENDITDIPAGHPPRKKQRLQLAGAGQLAERIEFGRGLSAGAALGKSLGSGHVFDPDTSHQQCQIIREEGSSDQQPVPPAASGSSTASPVCSGSLPEHEAATSTSLPLYFRPLSESRSKEREVISHRGFPTQLQTSGNEIYHTDSNLHLGPTVGQSSALVSPRAGALHLQKQDFLPKYQLKWTKKEPSMSSHPPP